jgi:hypothetical protein
MKMLKRGIITATFFIIATSVSLEFIWTEDIDGQREIINQFAGKVVVNNEEQFQRQSKAPVAISGDNIYVAWWTNDTANNNNEVFFRASTDGGLTFGDKINLSNSTNSDSWKVKMTGEGDRVVATWWETNQADDTPVMRVSNDGGATFGPLLSLATNRTIGEVEEE